MNWFRKLLERLGGGAIAKTSIASDGLLHDPLSQASTPRSAPVEAPWTANDADGWRLVIESDLGRRLVARARAVHYESMAAVTDPREKQFTTEAKAHSARGWAECVNWLISLGYVRISPPAGAQAGNDEERTGESAFLERSSP